MTSDPPPRRNINTVRIISVLLILPILAFACFGLVASFEPLDGGEAWVWRGAYLVLVLGCLFSLIRFLRMK
ncbi:MAG: hypothetical protein AAF368_03570 [Planctomycetota bacterium]